MTATTRPRWRPLPGFSAKLSPTLLYHKWHAYDDATDFGTKESSLPFLERVAELANAAAAGETYRVWQKRYLEAIEKVGLGSALETVQAQTVWRFVAGAATNPALETGITLHPFLGFPYLPGSAVRGLVRRAAECALTESKEAAWNELLRAREIPELPPEPEMEDFLKAAEKVKLLLGSLAVAPVEGREPVWTAPLQWERKMKAALANRPEDDPIRRRVSALFDEPTGGLLTFYDAVPLPGQSELLQTDLLNPHYPKYYRDPSKYPPSDDQDPIPVYFLAVKPGAGFVFPYRLARLPEKAPFTREEALGAVEKWLRAGLETWGAGAKTAAGYGYFQILT